MRTKKWLSEDIITLLDNCDGLTCTEIHERLDVPKTTVHDHLIKLERNGIIHPMKDLTGKIGHPRVLWKLWRLGKRKDNGVLQSE